MAPAAANTRRCWAPIRSSTTRSSPYASAPVCRTVTSSGSGCRSPVTAIPAGVPSELRDTPTENRSRGSTAGSA